MWTDSSDIWGVIRRAIHGTTVTLQSPLTLAQCLDRLRQNTDPYWRLFGSKPVVGWVRGQKFSGHKRINYRNSFQTRVAANFEDNGGGCHIMLRFGAEPFVQAFMAFWMTGVLGIGGAVSVSGLLAVMHGSAAKDSWMALIIPPLMAAFGIGLYKFGRWLARNEQTFLLEFMMATLAAKPAT